MSGKDKDKDKQEKQSTTERLIKGEMSVYVDCFHCQATYELKTTCGFWNKFVKTSTYCEWLMVTVVVKPGLFCLMFDRMYRLIISDFGFTTKVVNM